jgi:serine/threonine protein phosphatase PrpC
MVTGGKFTLIDKVKLRTGFYQPRIESGIGLTRSWFGHGKTVPGGLVFGGGPSVLVEERWLGALINADKQAPVTLRQRILEDVINGKKTFDHLPHDMVRPVLEGLKTDSALGPLADKALALLKKPSLRPSAPPAPPAPPLDIKTGANEAVRLSGGAEGKVKNLIIDDKVAGGLTDKAGRSTNEDGILVARSFVCCPNKFLFLLAVADGMGGHGEGEKAADAVLKVLEKYFERSSEANFNFETAFTAASKFLAQQKEVKNIAAKDAGTTLVAAFVDVENNRAVIASMGDSRAYLCRDGKLQMLTIDDNFMVDYLKYQQAADDPTIKALKAALGADDPAAAFGQLTLPLSPELSALVYQLGTDYFHCKIGLENQPIFGARINRALDGKSEQGARPSLLELALQPGDLIITTSDGVHDYCSYQKLSEVIAANRDKSPAEIAAAVRGAVEDPKDNITVAVYRHGTETAAPAALDRSERDEAALLAIAGQVQARFDEANAQLGQAEKIMVAFRNQLNTQRDDVSERVARVPQEGQARIAELRQQLETALQERRPEALAAIKNNFMSVQLSDDAIEELLRGDRQLIEIRESYERVINAVPAEVEEKIASLSRQDRPVQQALAKLAQHLAEQEGLVELARNRYLAEKANLDEFVALNKRLPLYRQEAAELSGRVAALVKNVGSQGGPAPKVPNSDDGPTRIRPIRAPRAADAEGSATNVMRAKDDSETRVMQYNLTLAEVRGILGQRPLPVPELAKVTKWLGSKLLFASRETNGLQILKKELALLSSNELGIIHGLLTERILKSPAEKPEAIALGKQLQGSMKKSFWYQRWSIS